MADRNDDRGATVLLGAMISIAIAFFAWGGSVGLSGLMAPLGHALHLAAAYGVVLAAGLPVVAVRILAAPFHLQLVGIGAQRRAPLVALALAVLDSILIFMVSGALQLQTYGPSGPVWSAMHIPEPWLLGADWHVGARLLLVLGVQGAATVVVLLSLAALARAYAPAEFLLVDFSRESWSAGSGTVALDLLVYLPVAVSLVAVSSGNRFAPTVLLSFHIVRTAAAVVFPWAALWWRGHSRRPESQPVAAGRFET